MFETPRCTCNVSTKSLVSQIAFAQAGALGLNLRTYLAEQPAGARLGLPPYGSLEVLDAQKFYLKASESKKCHGLYRSI